MGDVDLLGRVVVVAGDGPMLVAVATAAARAGALVAVVSRSRPDVDTGLCFRADPADRDAWPRIAPQVEQRLGPVDAVVADPESAATCRAVFDADLHRRGRGGVITVDDADDASSVLSRLARRR